MRPEFEENRFVFADAKAALTAVEVLVGSGIRSSRLSIHLWGRDFAVRALGLIGPDVVDRMTAIGGELHIVRIGPDGPSTVVPPRVRHRATSNRLDHSPSPSTARPTNP